MLVIIAIGRNEGDRLKACLQSVLGCDIELLLIYVDSGSTDGSVEFARSAGCEVVELDMAIPFTAARARNAGLARALSMVPNLNYVQFVDGDCEIVDNWLESAVLFLDNTPKVAVVSGLVTERFATRSIYNQLCDIEWKGPTGAVKSCGGNAMFRVAALREVGGYRSELIAGEEPELCVRIRAQGWKIWRLDQSMVIHDAAMYRFKQWWSRRKRGGYAFAQGASLHGAPPENHWVREVRSNWFWGLWLPFIIALGAVLLGPWVLSLLLIYPIQVLRIYSRFRLVIPRAGWYSFYIVLGKFPEMLGQLKFFADHVLGTQTALIEHK